MRFPEGFLWGTATSAHQVEGMNIHNDWWEFEQQEGAIWDNQVSGQGPDHYNRYEEDFDIAKNILHNNAYRFSVEWSRIEPLKGVFDEKAIAHYQEMLRALKERGFAVMLTLHHFTLPLWVTREGGWTSAKTVRRFENFAAICADRFSPWVDIWCTINEPTIYVYAAHVWAEWPPKKKGRVLMYQSLRHLAQGHVRAYKKIHKILDTKDRRALVGFAHHFCAVSDRHKNRLINWAYRGIVDRFQNHYVYSLIKNRQDYIGINYYYYRSANNKEPMGSLGKNDLGWDIYPRGLFYLLKEVYARFSLPIYITENGIAAADDDQRIRFIINHLKEVYNALQEGIDVRGYFHWSLLDNFEWNKGYTPKFGLVAVNEKTKERIPKRSAFVYGEISRSNGLSPELSGNGKIAD